MIEQKRILIFCFSEEKTDSTQVFTKSYKHEHVNKIMTKETSVISVRVRKDIKEEARRLGIDIKKVIEKTLEEEIKKAKARRLEKLVEEALNSIEFTAEEWVKVIEDERAKR